MIEGTQMLATSDDEAQKEILQQILKLPETCTDVVVQSG